MNEQPHKSTIAMLIADLFENLCLYCTADMDIFWLLAAPMPSRFYPERDFATTSGYRQVQHGRICIFQVSIYLLLKLSQL